MLSLIPITVDNGFGQHLAILQELTGLPGVADIVTRVQRHDDLLGERYPNLQCDLTGWHYVKAPSTSAAPPASTARTFNFGQERLSVRTGPVAARLGSLLTILVKRYPAPDSWSASARTRAKPDLCPVYSQQATGSTLYSWRTVLSQHAIAQEPCAGVYGAHEKDAALGCVARRCGWSFTI